jgi:tRNA A37 methylthiotransferase MiaB
MKQRENICNYLDMPLQHAANNMLKAMKRQITREEMEELTAAIREKVPGICLRTTLIAGFPGEKRDDVEELKTFIQKMRFDRVGIFTYSHEEGTSAHDIADDVPAGEKEERAQEVKVFCAYKNLNDVIKEPVNECCKIFLLRIHFYMLPLFLSQSLNPKQLMALTYLYYH